jgi:preprotein translocase subunit SecG
MTSRGTANLLTRTTSVLAAIFFATSIILAMTAERGATQQDVIETLTGEKQRDPNAPITTEDLLDTLGAERPASATPETAAPEASPAQPSGAPVLEAAPVTAEPAPDAAVAAPETPAETTEPAPQ